MTEQVETAAEWLLGGVVFCIGISVLLLLHAQYMEFAAQLAERGTETVIRYLPYGV